MTEYILFPALYPILHLSSDNREIQEKIDHPKKLLKSLSISGENVTLNQAVYKEMESMDIAKDGSQYSTNSIILLGCKVHMDSKSGYHINTLFYF